MSYDPDSINAQKGTSAEEIVKKWWKSQGIKFKRPADTFESGASIVDYEIYDEDNFLSHVAEIKTQAAYPFGVEHAPCYSFPKDRIDAYCEYLGKNSKYLTMDFIVVDPSSGYFYIEDLDILFDGKIIGREYPVTAWNKGLNCNCYYFHREQFSEKIPIEPDDLANLRSLFNIGKAGEKNLAALGNEFWKTFFHDGDKETTSKDAVTSLAEMNVFGNDKTEAKEQSEDDNGEEPTVLVTDSFALTFVVEATVTTPAGAYLDIYRQPTNFSSKQTFEGFYVKLADLSRALGRKSSPNGEQRKKFLKAGIALLDVSAQCRDACRANRAIVARVENVPQILSILSPDSTFEKWFRANILSSYSLEAYRNKRHEALLKIAKEQQRTKFNVKGLVNQLADITGIVKEDLIHTILDMRLKKFEQEQTEFKNLLIPKE